MSPPPSITTPQKKKRKMRKKSLKRKAIFAAKVGASALGVVSDFMNPIKLGSVVVKATQGKGFVYPGTKYIGPGNPLHQGKPVSKGDAVAMQHDYDYDRLLKKGVKPYKLYTGFSEADKRAMKQADVTTKHGLVIYSGLGVKKGLYKLGVTGKLIRD